jgi:hypothetical protein
MIDSAGESGSWMVARTAPGSFRCVTPWSRLDPDHPVRRARWRLDAYGGDAAAQQLQQLIDRWQQIERAGRTELQIIARRSADALETAL